MIIYKVYCKDYKQKRGSLLGVLAERRKDLRGKGQLESGLRWAMLTFGSSVKDRQTIFVVPRELDAGDAARALTEKGIFSIQEFSAIVGSGGSGQEMRTRAEEPETKAGEKNEPLRKEARESRSYNWFYGFSEKPFEITTDPRFLYLTPSHRDALTAIIDGIKDQTRFISITGEPGTGKTTLIRFLLSKFGERVKTAFIFHPSITFRELLINILLELGLRIGEDSEKALLSQLHESLLHKLAGDETLVVIIDEAQSLREGVLEKVGSRLSDLAGPLQIIFSGQPEFEKKLSLPRLAELNRRTGIRRQIKVLTGEESKRYIDHRLKLVGGRGSETFTPKARSMIFHYSQGIPRMINLLCDHALQTGYRLSVEKIGEDIIRNVIRYMEGPQKTLPDKIVTAVKELRMRALESGFIHKKGLFLILSLGLVFC